MNPQLLILGNGFDLHCGLHSDYNTFFRQTILDTTVTSFKTFRPQPHINGFWECLLVVYCRKYGDVNYNWCDIETIIKDTLWRICGIDEQTSIIIWKNALESVKLNRDPDEEIKSFKNETTKYLYRYCMLLFYKNLDLIKKHSDDEALNLLIENLLDELHDFESRFCKYIKDNIVNPQNGTELNTKYIVNAANLLAKLTNFTNENFTDISDIVNPEDEYITTITSNGVSYKLEKEGLTGKFNNLNRTHILSFNYTALFDILKVKSPCLYSNVHGKLCDNICGDGCPCSSIIFGIDDSEIQTQEETTNLRIFSKTYRKMLDTSSPTSILPPNNGAPLDIIFYGHSLSKADYSYFQSIFDYYNIYGNNKISLLFYYSKGFEQTDAIYNLFNAYGKTLSNSDQGKNLIHKLLLENRLKIIELEED